MDMNVRIHVNGTSSLLLLCGSFRDEEGGPGPEDGIGSAAGRKKV